METQNSGIRVLCWVNFSKASPKGGGQKMTCPARGLPWIFHAPLLKIRSRSQAGLVPESVRTKDNIWWLFIVFRIKRAINWGYESFICRHKRGNGPGLFWSCSREGRSNPWVFEILGNKVRMGVWCLYLYTHLKTGIQPTIFRGCIGVYVNK